MTEAEFENLLLQSESTILDFKKEIYSFEKDPDNKKTAEFIKDIISFSNTIRTEKAIIILGVELLDDGRKNLVGLSKSVDDSILQQKVKDKVIPIPAFYYKTIIHHEKLFGVIEIPIKKYEHPISPTVRLKGLEPGKFYFRRGSSNSEANGLESVQIANWLKNLPEETSQVNLSSIIGREISNLVSLNYKLSVSISSILQVAIDFNISELRSLCENELRGSWGGKLSDEQLKGEFAYRVNEVVVFPGQLEFSPNNFDSRQMIDEIKRMKDSSINLLFFSQSIIEIEEILSKLSEPRVLYSKKLLAGTTIIGEKENPVNVTVYLNKDNFDNIYKNIRQKLIDKLLFYTNNINKRKGD